MQCARILEAVLGEGSHPDEAALQRAAAEQLKAILVSEETLSEADAIRGFVARFVFELMLVELQAGLTAGRIDTATATRKEGRVKRWLEARVKAIALPGGESVAPGSLETSLRSSPRKPSGYCAPGPPQHEDIRATPNSLRAACRRRRAADMGNSRGATGHH